MIIRFDCVSEYLTRGFVHFPRAANENRELLGGGSPAEALAMARDYRERFRRENAEQATLLGDPKRRAMWEELCAFERCILWWHFEERR